MHLLRRLCLVVLLGCFLSSFTDTCEQARKKIAEAERAKKATQVVSALSKSGRDRWNELQAELDRLVVGAGSQCHIGLEVVSLKNGQKLYQKDANKLFLPGSTLQIFTAATALDLLGVDYRFETNLWGEQGDQGKLSGSLYIKGSGDPSLSTEDLQELVFQLRLQGVQEVAGDLIVDTSDFDEVAFGPGWMWDEGAEFSNAPTSALTVNQSCIDVWVLPLLDSQKRPRILLNPQTSAIPIYNQAVIEPGRNTLSVIRRWVTKENIIDVKGRVPPTAAPVCYKISVESPSLYAGSLLKELLEKEGIVVKGKVGEGKVPEGIKCLATHRSEPLRLIVSHMLKKSDNLYADCLYKKIGGHRLGLPGTWAKGSQAIKGFLCQKVGINAADLVCIDGSGGSRYNLASPHQIVQLLSWIYEQFSFDAEFMAALPISGTDGGLEERMATPVMKGKVRAKTGTMTAVSGLAGYAGVSEGEMVAFSILINGFVKANDLVKTELEDQICAALVSYLCGGSVENSPCQSSEKNCR